ncbi:hypothetical protein [Kitasatospora phosalacinea]|uniref:hypothetical protein n=1 Tax=Kitasatospora phosalacinea TaxID=2065 RepID=UPI0005251E55|nr:hypothetical protein [Kitasatospora phosalacinea]
MPARAVPYRKGLTALLALIPVLTLGLLGTVPSMVLALDRRRRADKIGAAVFGLMQVALFVSIGLTPKDEPIDNLTGGLLLLPLFLAAPVHFLLMNRREQWPATAPAPYPYPYAYPQAAHPQAAYPQPVHPQAAYPQPAHPVGSYPPAQPYPPAAPAGPTVPAAPAVPTGVAELRELGELLRRQAGDGQP